MYNIFNYFKNPFSTSFYCFFAKKESRKTFRKQRTLFAIYLCSPHNLHNLIYIRDTLIGLYEGRFPSQPGFREYNSNTKSQCLKITEKVSFNIVSDASYVKDFRQIERKSAKFPEIFPFRDFFSSIFVQDLFGYTVSRQQCRHHHCCSEQFINFSLCRFASINLIMRARTVVYSGGNTRIEKAESAESLPS